MPRSKDYSECSVLLSPPICVRESRTIQSVARLRPFHFADGRSTSTRFDSTSSGHVSTPSGPAVKRDRHHYGNGYPDDDTDRCLVERAVLFFTAYDELVFERQVPRSGRSLCAGVCRKVVAATVRIEPPCVSSNQRPELWHNDVHARCRADATAADVDRRHRDLVEPIRSVRRNAKPAEMVWVLGDLLRGRKCRPHGHVLASDAHEELGRDSYRRTRLREFGLGQSGQTRGADGSVMFPVIRCQWDPACFGCGRRWSIAHSECLLKGQIVGAFADALTPSRCESSDGETHPVVCRPGTCDRD
ncbi:hypothetical protein SAMN04488591_0941 [Microbacterium azadirachtae]|uniref:Uncharacterized protein n=1 Tax=Microbacterium azadirachtae TaxID=582680 RepID=A0A1I6GAB1_9MICO|nr:hypothetical protein SAMN04488593_0939 [Microbacterium azadirachtae]SEF70111.1 hypothetical protein SAMN04488594_0928 [Microbacterium azadirachtae]SEF70855.1 hypothetical protein SAMN04488592_0937 [Microbacterium azadirachtae]SFR39133.1 hypothetical protein SAMN04488591_0941 [Microbacterium azadirachtae]